jgi:hypothetical protein
MAVNFSITNYLPCQELFGRPVSIKPIASQPGGETYTNRGIYGSGPVNSDLEDGTILSDQDTILDIRDDEYPILPEQGDEITIDVDPVSGRRRLGVFMVSNVWDNDGGEVTLQLKKIGE